jgi:16S rRNA (guanine1516-N2)-methyltransferase
VNTVVTTGGRPDELSTQLATEAAKVLGYLFVERKKRSVARLQQDYDANCLVAGKYRFELYRIGMDKPFFFHPNSAAFRLKRLLKGESDPLIETAQLQKGDSFLDCTLGLASDSIIASFITGENGRVTGIEGDPDVAFITGRGLCTFPSESEILSKAMARVKVVSSDAVAFLREQPDAMWDVVYLDPMFNSPIIESSNFTPLRQVGIQSSLTDEWFEQALRVSKKRVVVKDRFDSPVFKQFDMDRQVRPNTKFHFGVIHK